MTDPKKAPRKKGLTRICKHCKGSQECRTEKTGNKTHSCEYCINCIKKSGVVMQSSFPVVPCQFCGGKGSHLLTDKKDNQNQNKNYPKNNGGGRYHGKR